MPTTLPLAALVVTVIVYLGKVLIACWLCRKAMRQGTSFSAEVGAAPFSFHISTDPRHRGGTPQLSSHTGPAGSSQGESKNQGSC